MPVRQQVRLPIAVARSEKEFTRPGNLVVLVGATPVTNLSGVARTIHSVRASLITAPTGAAAIFDVNMDGSTIFTDQAARPTIAAGAKLSTGGVPAVATWGHGQQLTADIDQIGSTVAGAGLCLIVEYS